MCDEYIYLSSIDIKQQKREISLMEKFSTVCECACEDEKICVGEDGFRYKGMLVGEWGYMCVYVR